MKKFLVLAVAVLATMISFNLLAECTGLSFDPAVEYYNDGEYYYPNNLLSVDLTGISDDYVGMLMLEFFPVDMQNGDWREAAAVGTYDLGTGNNANYESCNQCVRLGLYQNNENYDYVADFFQQTGTIQITKTDFTDEAYPYYEGILTVKLAEATIDKNTYQSSFVEGGDCYEIESAAWSNFPEDYVPGDTGDTGSDPADTGDTGDTGSDPADTGDTGDTGSSEPADTGDTEVPGDTDAPADDTPPTDNTTPAEEDEDEDEGGCALVIL